MGYEAHYDITPKGTDYLPTVRTTVERYWDAHKAAPAAPRLREAILQKLDSQGPFTRQEVLDEIVQGHFSPKNVEEWPSRVKRLGTATETQFDWLLSGGYVGRC